MTRHTLQGRSEDEVLWFRRRNVLQAAAAWTAGGGFAAAQAQASSNVVQRTGDVLVNGQPLQAQQQIQTGDRVQTGPGSNLVFVIGNASFQVRQNSNIQPERGPSLNAVSLLRLVTGGVAAVWGKGLSRMIVTPTITAGIRGTGVYLETRPNGRSYLCNCYGTVDVGTDTDRVVSVSDYHQSFWGEVAPVNGRTITPAEPINHTDEEIEFLARLINQPTGWETMGRKGARDGTGTVYGAPAGSSVNAPTPAPAAPPPAQPR